jgi:hypothetical protein
MMIQIPQPTTFDQKQENDTILLRRLTGVQVLMLLGVLLRQQVVGGSCVNLLEADCAEM